MSRNVGKPKLWILTRSDTSQAEQPLEMARGLKFWIQEIEGLYYPCSENKGADQLCDYRKTDLRLCFRICKTFVLLTTLFICLVYISVNALGLNITTVKALMQQGVDLLGSDATESVIESFCTSHANGNALIISACPLIGRS